MNRKEFLQTSGLGLCCGVPLIPLGGVPESQEPAAEIPVSPCDEKVRQGQAVIRRLMQQLDAAVDGPTREAIMENCGAACYEGAHGKRDPEEPSVEHVQGFLSWMRRYLGEENVVQEGADLVIYFKYKANPRGLKVADGYCLCPILEDAPRDISPTYCHCSIGYVREIFERNTGKSARVELTDSVLRGGKSCSFTVRIRT